MDISLLSIQGRIEERGWILDEFLPLRRSKYSFRSCSIGSFFVKYVIRYFKRLDNKTEIILAPGSLGFPDGRDADLEKIYRRLGFIPLTDDVGVEMTDNTILADVYPVEQINLQYFDSQLSWYYKNGSAYQDGLS
ncbi:hypothetical protein TI04_10685 [Achromatium sp. WMS2]|nr:hypothetical protein TI04_10685 [Achromatium sp. WMS2]